MYSRVISIKLNGKDIKCIIYYKKIRTLSLRIKNNENIIYSPMRLSVKYIKNFILKSLPRLIERHKKINAIKKINLEKNIIFVMGEKYLIQKDEKINDDFEIKNNTIFYKEKLEKNELKKIYFLLCDEYVKQRIHFWEGKMKLKNYTYKYKWLCSRWGVCNIYKKIITLSYKLFAHKKDIIDYVIVHEMAHSFVPNHSKKFWIEVEKIIPNWKTLRKELNYKYAY